MTRSVLASAASWPARMTPRILLLSLLLLVPIAATLAAPTASAGCVSDSVNVHGAVVVVDVGTPTPGATCATSVQYYGTG